MTEPMTLDALAVGESMVIAALSGEASMRRRLEDLGFGEGALVSCLGAAPLGDPRAYLVCGTVIALRRKDAAGIFGFGGRDGTV
jgi:ferrous iron transport protein A